MKLFLEAAISTILTLIITYVLSIFLIQYKDNQFLILAFSIGFLVLYSVLFSNWKRIKAWWIMILRKVFPKIAILNGNIDNGTNYACERSWTNITPSQWEAQLTVLIKKRIPWIFKLIYYLTRQKFIQLINVNEIDDRFSIIINPFGDNFPEEDYELNLTFSRIRNYMNNGGIFVVTGGAFYAHQNTKVAFRCEPTIVREHIQEGMRWQSLADTLLFLKFGIAMTSDQDSDRQEVLVYQAEEDKKYVGDLLKDVSNPEVKRFRALKKESSSDYMPLLREKNRDYFPIALVKQRSGALLHIGLYLESEAGKEFYLAKEVICRIFVKSLQVG